MIDLDLDDDAQKKWDVMDLNYSDLKRRQRADRDAYPPALALRTHRALSWLNRAESETEDLDAKFIFLWIAFNAAYANNIHNRQTFSERGLVQRFINRLVDSDREKLLHEMVWDQFPGPIRLLIDNRYVFGPFWDFQNGKLSEAEWKSAFSNSKNTANRALGRTNTKRVLGIVLERLHTLRNQVIHGGATWASGANRDQIRDGVTIMGLLVPIVIHVMMENAHQVWGEACYPVVD